MLSSARLPGRVPERPKGAVCKIAGEAYGGSNPPPPTHTTRQRLAGIFPGRPGPPALHKDHERLTEARDLLNVRSGNVMKWCAGQAPRAATRYPGDMRGAGTSVVTARKACHVQRADV